MKSEPLYKQQINFSTFPHCMNTLDSRNWCFTLQ